MTWASLVCDGAHTRGSRGGGSAACVAKHNTLGGTYARPPPSATSRKHGEDGDDTPGQVWSATHLRPDASVVFGLMYAQADATF